MILFEKSKDNENAKTTSNIKNFGKTQKKWNITYLNQYKKHIFYRSYQMCV